MTRDLRTPFAWLVALLLYVSLRACGAAQVHAQDDETLLTARVCLSETLPSASNAERAIECVQIVHATAERAVMHGRSYLAELRSYSPRATGVEEYAGRAWIPLMHPHRTPLVSGMNAELARVRFAALVAAAWRGLHGEEPPCPSALEWGSLRCRACRVRMREARYVRVDGCGANAWFMRRAW